MACGHPLAMGADEAEANGGGQRERGKGRTRGRQSKPASGAYNARTSYQVMEGGRGGQRSERGQGRARGQEVHHHGERDAHHGGAGRERMSGSGTHTAGRGSARAAHPTQPNNHLSVHSPHPTRVGTTLRLARTRQR